MDKKEKIEINVDFQSIANLAHVGVRRAVLFMGLGLNAAAQDDFQDYELHKLPLVPGQTSVPMDFFPSNLPKEKINEFKEAFALWIIGCGLRELLEHYAIFLDHVHRYALLFLSQSDGLGDTDPEKEQIKFNRNLGIPAKLAVLEKRFGITSNHSQSIEQLYSARNCLTHDLGIVSQKRCDADDRFIVTWRTMDIFTRGDLTGEEGSLVDIIGKVTTEETSILARQLIRRKEFSSGDRLILSQQDLWEICFFFKAYAIPSTTNAFIEFAKEKGIKIKE